MPGYPRENEKNKGFWNGGSKSHGANGQSGGKASGYPGSRTPTRRGVHVDLEFPESAESQEPKR